MAVTHVAFPLEQATWSLSEAMYTLTRVYRIDGDPDTAIATPAGPLPTGIPRTVEIIHTDPNGTAVPVFLGGVERQARRVKVAELPGEAFTEVIVTYEGHVFNIYLAEQVVSTVSEKIILSLDAVQLSIGANAEGITRLVPESTLTIVQVLPDENFALRPTLYTHIPALTGSVNEAGWRPRATDILYPEGAWLFVGAEPVRNRDSSYTITYSFESRDTNPTTPQDGMGFFNFFYTKDVVSPIGGEDRTRKEILGAEQTRKIYPIAGTDTANGIGGISSFSQLNI